MDFKTFVENFKTMTCVISVEKFPDGTYGNIRIVTGNKAYIDSIEKSPDSPRMLSDKFIPNSRYETYLQKDLNFEDFCYRCAVLKQPMHTYVHPDRFDFWFNIFMLPLESDEENIFYCTYTQELSKEVESTKMSNISQEAASDVLNACIKMRESKDFTETMTSVISDIRQMCGAAFCYMLLLNFNNRTCTLIDGNSDIPYDAEYSPNWFSYDFFDIAETWENTIAGSNCLIVKNESDMEIVKERNPVWYNSLKNAKVPNIALFPLKKGNDVLGYIWVSCFDTEKTVQIKETLELTTFFLSSEVYNHQLFEKLRLLSTIDILTGVFNRNEMNNRVDQFVSGEDGENHTIGVIFTDLNGLKQVNDSEGHAAGDTLLRNASAILKIVFAGSDIFRAGGDEFLIMVRDTQQELVSLVSQLKKHSAASGAVSFAIGACFEEDRRNIRKAMKIADERMYEDKLRFYKDSPDKARR